MMRPKEAKTGVGLVLTCKIKRCRHVLLLEECDGKPELGKFPGMHSIPMETMEATEDFEAALRRLMKEELSGLESHINVGELIGQYQIVSEVWLRAYYATCRAPLLPDATKLCGDVKGHYWMPLPEAVKHDNLRAGAFEPLQDSLYGRVNVTYRQCRWPNMVQALPAAS